MPGRDERECDMLGKATSEGDGGCTGEVEGEDKAAG
jgi:hypothetical protein